MSFNQFTNLDFNTIRAQIKDYLRANTNFTDFDFEGSNFSILIDTLAYNSYITSFNTNMAVNESFIDSATLRENVVSLARNIGYVPQSRRASRATISFEVLTSTFNVPPASITLKAGIVALGAVESGSYIFSIPEDITVSVNSNGIARFSSIDVYEGSYVTKSYVVDYSNSQQKFILDNPGIDTTTLRVFSITSAKREYLPIQNIFNVDKDTRFYLLQEVLDEKYQIIFGDDVIGKRPENGSTIFASYIITNGKNGNGAQRFTFSGILEDNNKNSISSGISLIDVITPSENGDDIESVDRIKFLAPRVYSSQYRAVTSNDYKALIPFLFPNVESVNAYGGEELPQPQYGKVFISVKPKNGEFISQASKERILQQLKSYSIAGIKPEIVDLKYLYVEIDTNVYYDRSKITDLNIIRNSVINSITNYSKSSDFTGFGGRLKYSKLTGIIDRTDGSITSNITKIKIRRNLSPIINRLASYEICFGNKFHIKKTNFDDNNGYNIKSSGFAVRGLVDIVYISDIPLNKTQGSIFLFKLVSGVPSIVLRNAGTVDYVKGEIILKPIIITSFIGNEIQIEAIPESNDVISLRDIYLQLDIKSLVVNVIEDTLASGYKLSGADYISTSSYPNGKYIR
jgi:hypothetical protein